MAVYAATHGEPDEPTTSRMRGRLASYLDDREARRRRRTRGLAGLVALLLVVGGGFAAATLGRQSAEGRELRGGTDAKHDTAAGELRLDADATVVVTTSGTSTRVELRTGRVELVPRSGSGPVEIAVGPFVVQARGSRLAVRAGAGTPLVTVDEGTALLSGPGLPAAGLVLRPGAAASTAGG
jgi:ferric-dicitrate binding protein FerR (iron transport regulator)